jgi:hypothetical protein
MIVLLGHHVDPRVINPSDPPTDWCVDTTAYREASEIRSRFRVRMVLAVLDACGAFFDDGTARTRLDRFLAYFQRYLFIKVRDAV